MATETITSEYDQMAQEIERMCRRLDQYHARRMAFRLVKWVALGVAALIILT